MEPSRYLFLLAAKFIIHKVVVWFLFIFAIATIALTLTFTTKQITFG